MNKIVNLKLILFSAVFFLYQNTFAQAIKPMPAGEILLNLKKLNVLGSALYIAAHPDDENTVMLSWLASERKMKTAYLSITRGDGGQNLIGPEQGSQMGLIRTQELLAARNIDGAEQYFTRANDFGFSKSTEETIAVWGKEKVISDIVWCIRKQRPDVIICRFPPDARAGHGNHSASAVLADLAFDAAADPTRFPEQLKFVKPWQAKRLVWNTFNFGATSQKPAEKTFIQAEIGGYNPLLGKSYTEIAAESRSQHKSQGFGVARNRGLKPEYFVHKKGELAQNEVFDNIDVSWKRVKNSDLVKNLIDETIQQFDPEKPSLSVPKLIEIYQNLEKIEDEFWKTQKQNEIKALIIACSGLYFEVNPNEYAVSNGENVSLTATIVNRSSSDVVLKSMLFPVFEIDTLLNKTLGDNELERIKFNVKIPNNQPISQPYWLENQKESKGFYTVKDQQLIGLPEKTNDISARFCFEINSTKIYFEAPVKYKYTDEIRGELYRNFEIRPAVTATITDKVYVFTENKPKTIEVVLKSTKANVKGEVALELPKGWDCLPKKIDFELANKFQEKKVQFSITPTKNMVADLEMKAVVYLDNLPISKSIQTISYEHIPPQTLFEDAKAKISQIDLKKKGEMVGYIAGAGDDVPAAIKQMGYKVVMLTETEMNQDFTPYQAIIVGVRAYNTEERLMVYQNKLLEYVQNGGNLIVQYQVNSNLQKLKNGFGPYPFKITRDRVTVEEAEMTFLLPQHSILNSPNKISQTDFNGWIQERGLYFANDFDANYTAVFSCKDPDEPALSGSLIHSKYGKGNFIYTGLSFFRQLPAGVSGAYRLFANLISMDANK
ncbi:MAG: PIG-L family deacetylase [Pseudarcicella sp.]|nr:PIG-L family deacetylase [Pseudarcicella sp.]